MTIIGIDDTDSAEKGMCTTFIGHRISSVLQEKHGADTETYLIRLNPAAKHKTRGNAAVGIHTTASQETAFNTAKSLVKKHSYPDDEETNPGVVCIDAAPNASTSVTRELGAFTERALNEFIDISTAEQIIEAHDLLSYKLGNGRGRIGSLAAIGAHTAFTDWTFEGISYRTQRNWGEKRHVAWDSVEHAHQAFYPRIWDNYDVVTGEVVCVPHTPCPVLLGVRGDEKRAVENASTMIATAEKTEEVIGREVFKSNQGTDVQFSQACIDDVNEYESYKIGGVVTEPPKTVEGGHVFTEITCNCSDECGSVIDVVAFEPTKRFRDSVRRLRSNDEITVFGEVSNETLKLEKFCVNSVKETVKENPYCESCEKSMNSMGADQGYRCDSCRKTTPEKVDVPIHRDLVVGKSYEVPPSARRHLTAPHVRMQ